MSRPTITAMTIKPSMIGATSQNSGPNATQRRPSALNSSVIQYHSPILILRQQPGQALFVVHHVSSGSGSGAAQVSAMSLAP